MLEQTFYDLAVQWRVSGWVGVCGKGGDWTAVAGRNRNRNPSFEWRSAFCQHIWFIHSYAGGCRVGACQRITYKLNFFSFSSSGAVRCTIPFLQTFRTRSSFFFLPHSNHTFTIECSFAALLFQLHFRSFASAASLSQHRFCSSSFTALPSQLRFRSFALAGLLLQLRFRSFTFAGLLSQLRIVASLLQLCFCSFAFAALLRASLS